MKGWEEIKKMVKLTRLPLNIVSFILDCDELSTCIPTRPHKTITIEIKGGHQVFQEELN